MQALRMHRVQTQPRVAAHKLGGYTIADARERRAIVKDQMRPREFALMRYAEAREAMIDHLMDESADGTELFMFMEYMASGYMGSRFATQNAALCIESLSCFLQQRDPTLFKGMRRERGRDDAPPMRLGGVLVDVAPDVLLRGENRNGKPIVGALKLHLSKRQALDSDAGQNMAALLAAYLSQQIARPGEAVSEKRCMVWDVFGQKLYCAPRATTNRLHVMEACCEEIAFRWLAG
jgi:hypothetical protein